MQQKCARLQTKTASPPLSWKEIEFQKAKDSQNRNGVVLEQRAHGWDGGEYAKNKWWQKDKLVQTPQDNRERVTWVQSVQMWSRSWKIREIQITSDMKHSPPLLSRMTGVQLWQLGPGLSERSTVGICQRWCCWARSFPRELEPVVATAAEQDKGRDVPCAWEPPDLKAAFPHYLPQLHFLSTAMRIHVFVADPSQFLDSTCQVSEGICGIAEEMGINPEMHLVTG